MQRLWRELRKVVQSQLPQSWPPGHPGADSGLFSFQCTTTVQHLHSSLSLPHCPECSAPAFGDAEFHLYGPKLDSVSFMVLIKYDRALVLLQGPSNNDHGFKSKSTYPVINQRAHNACIKNQTKPTQAWEALLWDSFFPVPLDKHLFFSPPLTSDDLCNICQTLESNFQKYVLELSKMFALAAALSIHWVWVWLTDGMALVTPTCTACAFTSFRL